MLNDNKLLRDQLQVFKSVSGYEHFPLLKINGLNYNGKLNMHDVKMYICHDIMSKDQCNFRGNGIFGILTGYWILYLVVGGVMVLFFMSLMICKRRLKERYDTELNLKIDQSIAGFLDK